MLWMLFLLGDCIMIRFRQTKNCVLCFFFLFALVVASAHGGKRAGSTQGKREDVTVDLKPVLKRALFMALGLDDWSGSSLQLTIEDEYRDLFGLRIKEQYVDANCTIFTLKEDYPVWIDSAYSPSWHGSSVNVHYRQRKNEKLWQKYLDDVRMRRDLAAKKKEAQDAGKPIFDIETKRIEMPPVWISVPEPNKARVFVSVYDRAGNESEAVEIGDVFDWFFSREDIDKFSKDPDEDYYLDTKSELGTHTIGLLSDVDNAALLYYQASLNRPQPDAATGLIMNSVLRGAEPDRNIRRYLKRCRETIRLAEAATLIPQCNWGISSSQRLGSVPMADLRHLSLVLSLYARALSADGHYLAALDSSLAIRRLARHTGDESVLVYLVARQIDRMALCTIQQVLGVMPPDAETLEWLRTQLAVVQGAPASVARALQNDFEFNVHNLRRNPDLLAKIRNSLVEKTLDEQLKEETRSLADEELIARACRPYVQFLNLALRTMDSELPYEEKYTKIRRLETELEDQQIGEPAAGHMVLFGGGQIVRQYAFSVRDAAHSNALKASTEIYLIQAKTGQLPRMLPEGLPKDPFSGRDFEYETTDDGFVLRCRARDLDASPTEYRPGQPPKILSDVFQKYEFKVCKQG